ncbi:MAG: hypothetical protein H0X66_12465 [Verrucomicrobia bacterium]|nr:hypothetical protein [Verrucomicrobiota bacterium]
MGKPILITFVLAIAIYVIGFTWIQHRRESKGPWVVEFRTDPDGTPQLVISQETLNIQNQTITFSDQQLTEKNLSQIVRFDGPTTNAPFGEIVFQDPTFLPGTVAFNFWSHGVEFMPRTMIINKEEVHWNTRTNIVLSGEGKFERRPVKKPKFL